MRYCFCWKEKKLFFSNIALASSFGVRVGIGILFHFKKARLEKKARSEEVKKAKRKKGKRQEGKKARRQEMKKARRQEGKN